MSSSKYIKIREKKLSAAGDCMTYSIDSMSYVARYCLTSCISVSRVYQFLSSVDPIMRFGILKKQLKIGELY